MTRIIIVDDHRMFRESLRKILTIEKVAEVIAEAANGNEFLSLLDHYTPDLALMDIAMPELNGIEATKPGHCKTTQFEGALFVIVW